MTIPPSSPNPNPTPVPKSNRPLYIILGIVGGVLFISCACCGTGLFFARRGAQRLNQSVKDGTIVEAVSGGRVSVTRMPAEFPSDVPVYEGAKLVMSVNNTTTDANNKGSMVQLTSTAKAQDVIDFYKSKMTDGGWIEETAMVMPAGTMLAYKKTNRTTTILVHGTDTETSIQITCVTQP